MDPFPDTERALVYLLADLAGGLGSIGTETPANLGTRAKYVRVRRFGGTDDGITDLSIMDIDAFATDRTTAIATAEAIRDRLYTGPHHVDGVVLDRVVTSTSPREIPWSGDEVRRWAATYRVTARRTPTPD